MNSITNDSAARKRKLTGKNKKGAKYHSFTTHLRYEADAQISYIVFSSPFSEISR
jgi:hypothetical protein